MRRHLRAMVSQALMSVRAMVTRLVERRDDRILTWQGDGALAAFSFNGKITQATLCGMEIIHGLFVYNLVARLQNLGRTASPPPSLIVKTILPPTAVWGGGSMPRERPLA